MDVIRRARVRRGVAAVLVLVAAACGDGSTSDDTTTGTTTTVTTTTVTTATVTTTTVTTTTVVTSTTSGPTSTSEPGTTVPYPTTTVHVVPADCDVAAMLAVADEAIAAARLEPGTAWTTDGTTTFDERTNDAEEFRDRLALDCRVRAVQRTDTAERLLVAGWTGGRRAFVVQASDGPASPYAPDQTLQLLFEQPTGEWLVDQERWAGTLGAGETVIVGVDDYSLGATAKAWQALPRWEDIPVTIETERHAIDVLVHAGARNVSPGDEPAPGSTIAAIQFVTPAGLVLVATVAPVGDFDPTAPIVEGERTVVEVGGVDVLVTRGADDSYAVGSVGWECGGYAWFVDSVWGTVDELVAWVAAVIAAAGCGGVG